MSRRKLVRDKIPDIIESEGRKANVSFAEGEEYVRLLREKLQEEVHEFLESGKPEELADILEVLFALGEECGVTKEALEEIREKKFVERGGFSQRIILEMI